MRISAWLVVVVGCIVGLASPTSAAPAPGPFAPPAASLARVQAALDNIRAIDRPGKNGYAAAWDGNKYVQCRSGPGQGFRCEAGGARMQPSLAHVLDAPHLARLQALGWRLDPSFGNYVRDFPPSAPTALIAAAALQVLAEAYDAQADDVEVETDWLADEACPPRNGPSQNLAGLVSDAPSMARFAVHACFYLPDEPAADQPVNTADALVARDGAALAAEIQRLRINASRNVFFAADTGIGYVQCYPQAAPPAIYCEAQSADSWPALASVLTPARIDRLHAAGFADPGHGPNYSKTYPADRYDDASIARELLTLLFDVYGYNGAAPLQIATEKGDP